MAKHLYLESTCSYIHHKLGGKLAMYYNGTSPFKLATHKDPSFAKTSKPYTQISIPTKFLPPQATFKPHQLHSPP